jgi:hypothetical protein
MESGEHMETTLYMHADILEIVSREARARGMTRCEMIVLLIKKVMANTPGALPMGRTVRYQGRRRPAEWRVVHVRVSAYEYEYMLDLRKLLKMSVSLICSYAVQKYLKRSSDSNIPDNYPFFMNYMVMKEFIGSIVSWRIIWGFTPDIVKQN